MSLIYDLPFPPTAMAPLIPDHDDELDLALRTPLPPSPDTHIPHCLCGNRLSLSLADQSGWDRVEGLYCSNECAISDTMNTLVHGTYNSHYRRCQASTDRTTREAMERLKLWRKERRRKGTAILLRHETMDIEEWNLDATGSGDAEGHRENERSSGLQPNHFSMEILDVKYFPVPAYRAVSSRSPSFLSGNERNSTGVEQEVPVDRFPFPSGPAADVVPACVQSSQSQPVASEVTIRAVFTRLTRKYSVSIAGLSKRKKERSFISSSVLSHKSQRGSRQSRLLPDSTASSNKKTSGNFVNVQSKRNSKISPGTRRGRPRGRAVNGRPDIAALKA